MWKKTAVFKEWSKSIQPITEVVNDRTKQASLKGKQFQVANPASNEEVEKAENVVILKVDATISKQECQAKDLESNKDFHSFLEKHCQLRHHILQIRNCNESNCCSLTKNPNGKLPWLPDPVLCTNKTHFTPFDEVVGKETTNKGLPSANIP